MQELMSRWSTQSPEQLVAKASQHLPIWVSLTLVVLIAYYLARVMWLLYPSTDAALWSPPQLPAPGQAMAGANASSATSYLAIVEAHLFGSASATDAPAVVETEDAPDTRLNLKLRAAVSATDDEVAHAIIADGSGNEQVYFIKSSIPGGATLHRVHPDRVILNRGGVLETLRLPRDFEGTAAATPRTAARSTQNRQNNVQQLLNDNAANFAEIIRPQPFMPNGQLKGYRVFPGRNRQQFIALGLRPGDLVTSVNGMQLNNPAQGMDVFRSLGNSSQINVTVERAGKQQELTLDIAQLAQASGNTR